MFFQKIKKLNQGIYDIFGCLTKNAAVGHIFILFQLFGVANKTDKRSLAYIEQAF
ncbi:hypothetical protein JCM15457_1998 [Liquorilactobacillus sucicola DSM 21376 = JCM 15457]|uniref:Uncharacterized protein n=1 Tax=Liquorilactobacillus sucicola DSM 21376 = JCM 15457 TaxID=1423806 RepID=A0A023CZM4_9LACO|nr:hypothetical protein FD15_GL000322 [Liquorilactobacillus sucicola DSM 21376 = JCM 15457]GAJ27041.1 hypothetical protein JCM15457_1998 [Liquorilactobacillus sucicola DSM 21376 = JCM 15457]